MSKPTSQADEGVGVGAVTSESALMGFRGGGGGGVGSDGDGTGPRIITNFQGLEGVEDDPEKRKKKEEEGADDCDLEQCGLCCCPGCDCGALCDTEWGEKCCDCCSACEDCDFNCCESCCSVFGDFFSFFACCCD